MASDDFLDFLNFRHWRPCSMLLRVLHFLECPWVLWPEGSVKPFQNHLIAGMANNRALILHVSLCGINQQIAHWPVECCSVHSRKDKISTGGVEAGRCLSEAAAPPRESFLIGMNEISRPK